jgi:hypothetical protein
MMVCYTDISPKRRQQNWSTMAASVVLDEGRTHEAVEVLGGTGLLRDPRQNDQPRSSDICRQLGVVTPFYAWKRSTPIWGERTAAAPAARRKNSRLNGSSPISRSTKHALGGLAKKSKAREPGCWFHGTFRSVACGLPRRRLGKRRKFRRVRPGSSALRIRIRDLTMPGPVWYLRIWVLLRREAGG